MRRRRPGMGASADQKESVRNNAPYGYTSAISLLERYQFGPSDFPQGAADSPPSETAEGFGDRQVQHQTYKADFKPLWPSRANDHSDPHPGK